MLEYQNIGLKKAKKNSDMVTSPAVSHSYGPVLGRRLATSSYLWAGSNCQQHVPIPHTNLSHIAADMAL